MRAVVLVLASLACVGALIATAHDGPETTSKDSAEDAGTLILLRYRRHVCHGPHECSLGFYCDPRFSECVAKHGDCYLLSGGRAVHGKWDHGACVSGDSMAFEGEACFILVEGTTFRGRWQIGVGAGGCVPEV